MWTVDWKYLFNNALEYQSCQVSTAQVVSYFWTKNQGLYKDFQRPIFLGNDESVWLWNITIITTTLQKSSTIWGYVSVLSFYTIRISTVKTTGANQVLTNNIFFTFKPSYHKLKLAGCVVSLKSIPTVTAIVAPRPSVAAWNKETNSVILCHSQDKCILFRSSGSSHFSFKLQFYLGCREHIWYSLVSYCMLIKKRFTWFLIYLQLQRNR